MLAFLISVTLVASIQDAPPAPRITLSVSGQGNAQTEAASGTLVATAVTADEESWNALVEAVVAETGVEQNQSASWGVFLGLGVSPHSSEEPVEQPSYVSAQLSGPAAAIAEARARIEADGPPDAQIFVEYQPQDAELAGDEAIAAAIANAQKRGDRLATSLGCRLQTMDGVEITAVQNGASGVDLSVSDTWYVVSDPLATTEETVARVSARVKVGFSAACP